MEQLSLQPEIIELNIKYKLFLLLLVSITFSFVLE